MDPADEDAQMAALMGFSAFAAPVNSSSSGSGSKKRKTPDSALASHADAQDSIRPEIGSGAARGNSNYLPVGQRRVRAAAAAADDDAAASGSVESVAARDGMGASDLTEATAERQGRAHAVLGKSLAQLTSEDLYVLRRGVPDADGRTVVFQPSFVEEDPWARLRVKGS